MIRDRVCSRRDYGQNLVACVVAARCVLARQDLNRSAVASHYFDPRDVGLDLAKVDSYAVLIRAKPLALTFGIEDPRVSIYYLSHLLPPWISYRTWNRQPPQSRCSCQQNGSSCPKCQS